MRNWFWGKKQCWTRIEELWVCLYVCLGFGLYVCVFRGLRCALIISQFICSSAFLTPPPADIFKFVLAAADFGWGYMATVATVWKGKLPINPEDPVWTSEDQFPRPHSDGYRRAKYIKNNDLDIIHARGNSLISSVCLSATVAYIFLRARMINWLCNDCSNRPSNQTREICCFGILCKQPENPIPTSPLLK